jgi:hypothetical protein
MYQYGDFNMNDEQAIKFQSEIENEIDFARAVTALMMAVKLNAEDTKSNRAELRLKSNYKSFESDVEKRAS